MNILITGVAGFIGFHSAKSILIKKKFKNVNIVVGIDNLNNYYSVKLKKSRLEYLSNLASTKFKFYKIDILDINKISKLFVKYTFTHVIHLAAQAGVRYSLVDPKSYINSNINGFFNILELTKKFEIKHLIFASSSSVYGATKKKIFKEKDKIDVPKQLYAATKIANEAMASSYSSLYGIRMTGLRFFTVYGPWGRPDMSPFIFVKSIINNNRINLYDGGNQSRDFTYIDDVISGINLVLMQKDFNNIKQFTVLNIGQGKNIKIKDFIYIIEKILKLKANIEIKKSEKGDMKNTKADINEIKKIGYIPKTNVFNGLTKFIEWYKNFY